MNQTRAAKILIFIGLFLALFYLQDFKRNIFITYVIEEDIKLYKMFEVTSSLFSILFLSIACFFQFKTKDAGQNKSKKNKKNSDELFV